jgi:hypothetical protein
MYDVTCIPNLRLVIWILLPPSTTSIVRFNVAYLNSHFYSSYSITF